MKEGHLRIDVCEGAPEAVEVEKEGGIPLDGVAVAAAASGTSGAGVDILASGGGSMEHAVANVVGVCAGGAIAGSMRAWGLGVIGESVDAVGREVKKALCRLR